MDPWMDGKSDVIERTDEYISTTEQWWWWER